MDSDLVCEIVVWYDSWAIDLQWFDSTNRHPVPNTEMVVAELLTVKARFRRQQIAHPFAELYVNDDSS